ncbi:hypothetical protein PS1_038686 [Malus domestica]
MKSNIGVVGTSSAVMMVMVFLLITGSAMATEKCRQRCYGGCGLPPTAERIEECQKSVEIMLSLRVLWIRLLSTAN